jgi:hypothetical protein
MSNPGFRYVASTVVIGPRGPCVTRGYMDIGGVRIYDDQFVVGRGGQREISPGWTEYTALTPPLEKA